MPKVIALCMLKIYYNAPRDFTFSFISAINIPISVSSYNYNHSDINIHMYMRVLVYNNSKRTIMYAIPIVQHSYSNYLLCTLRIFIIYHFECESMRILVPHNIFDLSLLDWAQKCWIHRCHLGRKKRMHAEQQTLQDLAFQLLQNIKLFIYYEIMVYLYL